MLMLLVVSGFIASLVRWPFQSQAKPQEQALTDEEMRDIFESTKTDPERLLRRYDTASYYVRKRGHGEEGGGKLKGDRGDGEGAHSNSFV